jgi:hypothetical protein
VCRTDARREKGFTLIKEFGKSYFWPQSEELPTTSPIGSPCRNALGHDDVQAMRATFAPGNLTEPHHSVNTDVNKRIRYLG